MQNFKYWLLNFYNYTRHTHDCDNCKYFGGCMCIHVDENGKCLGWEKEEWHPIHNWWYNYKINRLIRKLKNEDKLSKLRSKINKTSK